ncbi:hypothetical protein ACB092_09G206900 [Castanea dentata]
MINPIVVLITGTQHVSLRIRAVARKYYPPHSHTEMESPSSKQFFVASLFILLAIFSYMNSSLAATLDQLSSEFITTTVAFHDSQIKEKAFATDIITTSVALTISPTTGDSRINIEKSFATKIITTSAPNTNIPDSTCTSTNHKVAPAPSPEIPVLRRKLLKGHTRPSASNPATYIPPSTNSSTNHKAEPAPSLEFPVLRRKPLKGHTPPSAPNPATYIPPSTSSSTNHKAAPAPSPGTVL